MVARHGKEPHGPGELSKRSWGAALKRTFKQFNRDNLTDWAAALTYYGVLSLFPGIIVLTAILGLLGPDKIQTVIDNVNQLVPGQGKDILVGAIKELTGSRSLAGPLAILGLLGALWSASGYIGAFMRASNAIYGMPEGRPIYKVIPLRVALTIAIVVLLALCALGVVATGSVARRIGDLIGLGSTGVLVWEIAKWPVIALLVSVAFALLYWVGPNVRQPGFKWLTPGGLLAVVLWVLASAGFALYVANFGSYNKTYGSLADRGGARRGPGGAVPAAAGHEGDGRRRSRGGGGVRTEVSGWPAGSPNWCWTATTPTAWRSFGARSSATR
jgi:membrane protein